MPAGACRSPKQNPSNLLTKTIDSDNHTTTMECDGAGLATKTVDGDSHTILNRYDGDGRVTAMIDGDSHTRATGCDGDGKVNSATDGAGAKQGFMGRPDSLRKWVGREYLGTGDQGE